MLTVHAVCRLTFGGFRQALVGIFPCHMVITPIFQGSLVVEAWYQASLVEKRNPSSTGCRIPQSQRGKVDASEVIHYWVWPCRYSRPSYFTLGTVGVKHTTGLNHRVLCFASTGLMALEICVDIINSLVEGKLFFRSCNANFHGSFLCTSIIAITIKIYVKMSQSL